MMARTNIMDLACLSPSVYDYTYDGVRLQGFFVSYPNTPRYQTFFLDVTE
jgi:hypothetical protein